MEKYNRSLAKELEELLIKDSEEEITQKSSEEQRIEKEKERDWRQRKYELSNRFGEEFIYDNKVDELYFEIQQESKYETDELGCQRGSSKNNISNLRGLQNTRGYNHAFVYLN
ncbi:hypothetical protein M0R72_05505 [Candidatus Pacearchaeota archaeon]|jgi:hypothetical protein|nr:hypothetical protein [Candidatus Pacearchaeota archaeon]